MGHGMSWFLRRQSTHPFPVKILNTPVQRNPWVFCNLQKSKPRCSMYGLFTYICPKHDPNVGKYSIHGASGKWWTSPVVLLFDPRFGWLGETTCYSVIGLFVPVLLKPSSSRPPPAWKRWVVGTVWFVPKTSRRSSTDFRGRSCGTSYFFWEIWGKSW